MLYRLTWNGTGSLDLPQILDLRGRPVLLTQKEPTCFVTEQTFGHPLLQAHLNAGLVVKEYGTKKQPAIPKLSREKEPITVPEESVSVKEKPVVVKEEPVLVQKEIKTDIVVEEIQAPKKSPKRRYRK